jgi:hypothetical protein
VKQSVDREYDPTDDFARSIDECYRVIRERKAAGGPGWPREAPTMADIAEIIERLRAELDDSDVINVELLLSRNDAKMLLHILQAAEDMRLQALREDRP